MPPTEHQTGSQSSSKFQQTLHQLGDICGIDFPKRSIINSGGIPIIQNTEPLVRFTHQEENIPVHGTLTRFQFEKFSRMMFFIEVIRQNELPLVPPYDLIQSKEDLFVVSGLITQRSPVQQHSISGSQFLGSNPEANGEKIVFTVNPPDQYSKTPSMFAIPIHSPDQPASPISVGAPSYTYQYRISMNLAFVLSIFYKCTVIHYDVAEYLSQFFSIKLSYRSIALRGAALRLACTVARFNSQLADFLEKMYE
ncbi:MAG: hypothetical protein EZS28_004401 [Streblomastix strix]|uniref:Uncharacterized protein n=1 Tax=Streblomastix strix TaxID=222440 RepID=A0A5J4X0S0_9EUKA|nr:MAG: hypothetical protein EZS28_004401 [Streblomastix strix]